MELIKIEDLTVTYDLSPVLWDIDLNIKKGSLLAIVGPNGAGKSTLIKAILNLIPKVTGSILFENQEYKKYRKKIGYVPQSGSVDWDFPTTVLDVVSMGRYGHVGLIKRLRKKDKEISIEALKKVEMYEFKDRQISELSGGQRQRVFLARALAQEADVYFLDEPFQGVDIKTEKTIINILKELKNQGKTILVVHHDLNTIEEYFDQICFLNKKIVAYGDVATTFNNENIEKAYKSSKNERIL